MGDERIVVEVIGGALVSIPLFCAVCGVVKKFFFRGDLSSNHIEKYQCEKCKNIKEYEV